jgi:serine/threonine protein kinase
MEEGGTSKIYKVVRRSDGKIFCLKLLNEASRDYVFHNEENILKNLAHKHVVQYIEAVNPGIIMEYVGGRTLYDIIKKKPCNENCTRKITKQLLGVLIYLGKLGIIHGDIKTENIVCETVHNIKIIDFGFSVRTVDGVHKGKLKFGTLYCSAPEMFSDTEEFTQAVDMWALGILMYCCLCGYYPFFDESREKTIEKIINQKVIFPQKEWENISKDVKHIIKSLLRKDPKTRSSAQKTKSREWFQQQKKDLE